MELNRRRAAVNGIVNVVERKPLGGSCANRILPRLERVWGSGTRGAGWMWRVLQMNSMAPALLAIVLVVAWTGSVDGESEIMNTVLSGVLASWCRSRLACLDFCRYFPKLDGNCQLQSPRRTASPTRARNKSLLESRIRRQQNVCNKTMNAGDVADQRQLRLQRSVRPRELSAL